MAEAGAEQVLKQELVRLRALTYEALLAMAGTPAHYQSDPVGGQIYQVERQVFWDSGMPPPKGDGNLRVLISVDDGSRKAFRRPLTGDFIVAPDGSFVGE